MTECGQSSPRSIIRSLADAAAARAPRTGATTPPSTPDHEAALETRRAVIDAQREELLRWRDAGRLPDASLRTLERELDHEERMFPGPDGH